jgi:hypothetical protein
MKTDEVPQDNDPAFEGHKKIFYAVDPKGKIVAAQSSGWNVEAVVKALAWEMIDKDLERTAEAVEQGRSGRLEWVMKRRQMDAKLLAQNMGLWKWRVKRHLRPGAFEKLSPKLQQRYAEILGVPLEELKS